MPDSSDLSKPNLRTATAANPNAPALLLPPSLPQVHHSGFVKWLARSILRVGGWRMEGAFPDLPRAVLIGAPHSSNWDGFWAMCAKTAMGLDIRILGKDSLFKVPLLAGLLRWLGIMAVDRSNPAGIVEQAAELIRSNEQFWYGLAPEGTRRKVDRWKQGFWRIAHAADVPVVPVYFDYTRKVIGVGEAFDLTSDIEADLARIQAWYRTVAHGKYHDI